MKNLKGGRPRLPLKFGANPNILNLYKTLLGTCWDAFTPLEAMDYTTLSEDVRLKTRDQWLLQESPDKTRGRSLQFLTPLPDEQF